MEYQHYDGMGVPIIWKILKQSRKPSDYTDYPYLYEGTTEEDYRFALSVEERDLLLLSSFLHIFSSSGEWEVTLVNVTTVNFIEFRY
jgi:hypothetical protein